MSDDSYNHALPIGTRINDFEILEILGIGGFGITYKAWDHELQYDVAIKEYMPNDLVVRGQSKLDVLPKSESAKKEYEYGLQRFLDEARTLARFKEPNIVRVKRHFRSNNTAYLVMDYEEGQSLSEYLRKHKKALNEEQIKAIIVPILDGLRAVHAQDFLHRDIKPGNIYLRKNGSPVLIDFGAARQAFSEHSKSLTGIISPGFAPFEQYSTHSKQGAWTDLYGIGATLYRCIANKSPVEAINRVDALQSGDPDPLVPAAKIGKGKYSEVFLKTVDWMLAPQAKDRPQTVQAVLERLIPSQPTAKVTDAAAQTRVAPRPSRKSAAGFNKSLISTIAAVLILGIAGVTWWLLADRDDPRITRILKLANEDISAGRLIKPAGSNALERCRSILQFDPENRRGKACIDKIAERFGDKAKQAATVGNIRLALRYYTRTKRIAANSSHTDRARAAIGSYYLAQGDKAVTAKNRPRAQAYANKAKAYVPDSSDLQDLARRIAKLPKVDPRQLKRGLQAYRSRDFYRAKKLLWPLARNGNAKAQNKVGNLYYYGRAGLNKNYRKAYEWFLRAAKQGLAEAQFSVGIMYSLGRGASRDDRLAEKWFLKSANQNNSYAQAALGILYEGKKNYPEALKWYIKSAKNKNTTAYYKIGYFYEKGRGISTDLGKAIDWYRLAARKGNRKAKKALSRLGISR